MPHLQPGEEQSEHSNVFHPVFSVAILQNVHVVNDRENHLTYIGQEVWQNHMEVVRLFKDGVNHRVLD